MRPCMRGIMGMTKPETGNNFFRHIEKVFFRPLPHLASRECRSGMRQKDMAQASLEILLLNDGMEVGCDIHNMLTALSFHP